MARQDGLVEALVEYEYGAEQDDELSLKPGDIITEVRRMDGGWWEGNLGGKKGVFPDNFVKVIDKIPKPKQAAQKQPPPVGHKQPPTGTPNPPNNVRPVREAKKRRRARVTYSYTPQNEDELELKVGELVEIINQEEEGWWEGSANGKQGVFPSNFVDMVSDDKVDDDFKEIKGKKIKGIGFGDIFAGGVPKLKPKKQGSTDSELTTSPPILNSTEPKPVAVRHQDPTPPVPRNPPPAKQIEHAKALYPYKAENEDELDLEEGDILEILDKDLEDSGWWRGTVHGRSGVFPDNFVELIQEEKPRRPAPPMPAKTRPAPPEPEKAENKDERKYLKDSLKKQGPPPPLGKKPGKNADAKLLSQTDDHKAQEQQSESAEPNPKLRHPTKERPKPPSTRQPPAINKQSSKENLSHATQGSHQVQEAPTTSPRTPVSPSADKNFLPEKKVSAASSAEIDQLKKELSELKTKTVPKQKYDELHEQMVQLKHQLEETKSSFDKRLYSVMMEVDEEKKLRLTLQVEIDRIKKLVAPS